MSEMSIAQACKILGVTEDMSAQDIRTARRDLVRANHPDLVERYERARADRRLSDINTAFDVMIALKSTRTADNAADTPGPHATAAARKHAQRNADAAQAQARARARAGAEAQATAETTAPTAMPPITQPSRHPHQAAAASAAPLTAPRTNPARHPAYAAQHAQHKARRDFESALGAVSHQGQTATRAEYA